MDYKIAYKYDSCTKATVAASLKVDIEELPVEIESPSNYNVIQMKLKDDIQKCIRLYVCCHHKMFWVKVI